MEEIEPPKEEKPKNTFLNTGSSTANTLAALETSGVATSESIFGSKPIADLVSIQRSMGILVSSVQELSF